MRVDVELSVTEATRLEELEAVIAGALLSAGLAFLAIREEGLYRRDYSSFEQYCRKKHRLSESYVTYRIRAALAYENLSALTDCRVLPQNEWQLRPLSSLIPEQQISVWRAAVIECNGHCPSNSVVQKHATRQRTANEGEDEFDDEGDCEEGEPSIPSSSVARRRLDRLLDAEKLAEEACEHFSQGEDFAKQAKKVWESVPDCQRISDAQRRVISLSRDERERLSKGLLK